MKTKAITSLFKRMACLCLCILLCPTYIDAMDTPDVSLAFLSVNGTNLEFNADTYTYEALVPYNYCEGLSSSVAPEVVAVPADSNAQVSVIMPDEIDGGTLLVRVTNGGEFCDYTISMSGTGMTMYENGNAEKGIWTPVWCNYELITDNPGEGNNSIHTKGAGYYTPDTDEEILSAGHTYLASSMVRKYEGYDSDLTAEDFVSNPAASGTAERNFDGTVYKWNSDGSERTGTFIVEKDTWLTHYRTIIPNTTGEVIDYYRNRTTFTPKNLVVDAHFLGELVVTDIKFSDTSGVELSAIEIPEYGTNETQIKYEILNQLGNRVGLCDETVALWKLADDYEGVSISADGVLSVDKSAEKGKIVVVAEVVPSWDNACQDKVIVASEIELTEPVDRSGAELADIVIGGLSVPNYNPKVFNYTMYVPYKYKTNDFDIANMPVPQVDAIAKKSDSIVNISYPDYVEDGVINITVTSADGELENTYSVTMKVVGQNMYEDGGFESEGTWVDSPKMIRTQEDPAGGNWAMIVDRTEGTLYYSANNKPTLKAGHTYITQGMVRGIPNTKTHRTYNYFVGVTPTGDNPDAKVEYYNSVAGVQNSFETLPEWQAAYAVITPKNNYSVSNQFTNWGKEDPIVVDEHFVGELSIASMTYMGENVGIIPASGEEIVKLDATFVNQFSNKAGFENETVKYELIEEYPGVRIEDNKLIITDNSVVGSLRVRAYVEPTFTNTQGKVAISEKITLSAADNASLLPQAKEVKLSGVLKNGEVLKGEYFYYQIEDKPEGATELRWYAENFDGTGRTEILENAGKSEFVVTSDYVEKRIYFEVTPIGEDGAVGKKVLSKFICKPLSPYAVNVKVTGEHYVGAFLEGDYEYVDPNSDPEDKAGVSYQWFSSDNASTDFTPIDGATESKYEIEEKDVDKYLLLRVTPKSTVEPYDGKYGESDPMLAAATPLISNVEIVKKSNRTFSVTYDYSHPVGIAEGESLVVWSVDGKTIDTENKTITLDPYVKGTLKVEVTVYASKEPMKGESGSAERKLSTSTATSDNQSYGGKGGTSVFVPVPEKKEEPEEVVKPQPQKHWAEDGIAFCKENGIMQDIAEGDFGNANTVSRCEIVSFIVKALGENEAAYTHRFNDVKSTDYFAGALQKAVNLGIISEADNFEPNRNVTRQEVCKILVEAFGKEIAEKADLSKFADNTSISNWAADYVAKSVSVGLLKGVSDTEFSPLSPITREQTAVILKRLCDLRNGGIAE